MAELNKYNGVCLDYDCFVQGIDVLIDLHKKQDTQTLSAFFTSLEQEIKLRKTEDDSGWWYYQINQLEWMLKNIPNLKDTPFEKKQDLIKSHRKYSDNNLGNTNGGFLIWEFCYARNVIIKGIYNKLQSLKIDTKEDEINNFIKEAATFFNWFLTFIREKNLELEINQIREEVNKNKF